MIRMGTCNDCGNLIAFEIGYECCPFCTDVRNEEIRGVIDRVRDLINSRDAFDYNPDLEHLIEVVEVLVLSTGVEE